MNSTNAEIDYEIDTDLLSDLIYTLIVKCCGNDKDIFSFMRWYTVLSNELIDKFCICLNTINENDCYNYIYESDFDEFLEDEDSLREFFLDIHNNYKSFKKDKREILEKNINSIIKKIMSLGDKIYYNIDIINVADTDFELYTLIPSHFKEIN